jgi:hypothetical protein
MLIYYNIYDGFMTWVTYGIEGFGYFVFLILY